SRISPIQLLRSEIEYLKQARAVFIQASNEVFEKVLRVCEKNNIPLFVTLQKEKAPRIDLLKSPIIKAVFANDDEITQEVLALEDKIVAVTYGAKGSVIRHKGREIVHDAFAVDAVDSTGAGDAFAGAFIYGHLSGWELAETARFSNFLGAVASTTFGSREALRNVSKEELLKSYASLPNPG
ncbi:MAG TPA: PfkB family carbohydrate kinase, partial [archaeon]|nr:PfkB family carbohydrate kinase [archaeon]